jgi:hypothetical protein
VIAVTAAAAQDAPKAALPDTTVCPEPLAAIATCYAVRDENGAFLTAAMPKSWNGDLIVFAHGGPSPVPPTANDNKSALERNAFAIQRGFAWVASSYRRAGYGIAMAAADMESKPARSVGRRCAKPKNHRPNGGSTPRPSTPADFANLTPAGVPIVGPVTVCKSVAHDLGGRSPSILHIRRPSSRAPRAQRRILPRIWLQRKQPSKNSAKC